MGTGLQYIPRIPSNIFCYISHFLQSNSNSPVKTPICKFSTRNPLCGLLEPANKIFKILQSNVKFSSRILNMEILQSNSNSPVEPVHPKFSTRNEKRFVKEQTYIKRPYPLLLHPFTAFGA